MSVIVVGARGTGRRASEVAELRADRLRSAAARQSVVGGERLRSGRGGCDGSDEHPARAAGIGGVVEVQVVRCEAAIGPYRCTDLNRLARRQSAAVSGLNDEAVVGFVGVEGSGRSIRAGVVDGVGLIGFIATGERVAPEQQRRTGIATRTDTGAGRSLER